jgi:hypothetical protein
MAFTDLIPLRNTSIALSRGGGLQKYTLGIVKNAAGDVVPMNAWDSLTGFIQANGTDEELDGTPVIAGLADGTVTASIDATTLSQGAAFASSAVLIVRGAKASGDDPQLIARASVTVQS